MRRVAKRYIKQHKGAILSLMVLLIVLISLSSLALLRVGQEARLRAVKSTSEISARFAADAGIERALYCMNEQVKWGFWDVGDVPAYTSEDLTGGNAEYTVTSSGTLASGYVLTSVGQSGRKTKTVRATIELTNPFADDYAVLARFSLSMDNKATIYGYNSSDPSETGVPVRIGKYDPKKGKIDIKNGTIVDGDVMLPIEGQESDYLSYKDRSDIAGEIMQTPFESDKPMPQVPMGLWYKGKISGTNVTLNSSDSGRYSKISISNDGKLTINGDLTLHVTGDIELKNNAEVIVEDGSSLVLYFEEDIEAKNSSGIRNKSKIPSKVKMFGAGNDQQVDLKNSSALYASMYGPTIDLTIYNNVDAYGSFIVEDFVMKNGGNVYYDKALKETTVDDQGAHFSVVRWEEL